MKKHCYKLLSAVVLLVVAGYAHAAGPAGPGVSVDPLPTEKYLENLQQLTFGGQNAEAYFSYDGNQLIFQSTRDDLECDAIFRMNADGSDVRQVSSGQGVTTCAFIAPDNRSIIYASTHLQQRQCPPKPDYSKGYVWPLHAAYDIFKAGPEGENPQRLTDSPSYDAEAVFSPKGDRIVFTSLRSGDLELYLMKPDGSEVEQLTDEPGYDGGAFFSLDGEWVVWRASRPSGEALKDYQSLLKQGLIRPGQLELFIMNLTERKPVQLTENGAANFGPYWHPDGKHIIFSSNMHDPKGRNFDLYLINIDSRKIERITHYEGFDGFPMFSHDGRKLVFASNRLGKVEGETNVFIADFVRSSD
ncbi:MAG: PD40 domain-containing protein [Gammaproteobacteria bacterium]|nr:PD40 domain-containing protein [Gammaproteobacteria bacterium]